MYRVILSFFFFLFLVCGFFSDNVHATGCFFFLSNLSVLYFTCLKKRCICGCVCCSIFFNSFLFENLKENVGRFRGRSSSSRKCCGSDRNFLIYFLFGNITDFSGDQGISKN